MELEPDFAEAAESFLEAVRRGDIAEQRRQFTRMQPVVRRAVRARFGRFRSAQLPPGVELEDVVQEVGERLLRSPPTGTQAGAPAAAVLAWLGATASNYLIGLVRRERVRPVEVRGDSARRLEREVPDPAKVAPERLTAVQRVEQARRVIEEHYPKGLPVFDALREDPDVQGAALAREFGTSVANIHQIRCRIRTTLALHLSTLD